MAGVNREAGNAHSSGTPTSTSRAKALYCTGCSLVMLFELTIVCVERFMTFITDSDKSASTFIIIYDTEKQRREIIDTFSG